MLIKETTSTKPIVLMVTDVLNTYTATQRVLTNFTDFFDLFYDFKLESSKIWNPVLVMT